MREAVTASTVWRRGGSRRLFTFRLRRLAAADSFLIGAGIIIAFIIACALVPSLIAPYSPTAMLTDSIMQAPSSAHLFGTDYFGRDIFSVVVYGSRDSLFIGFASVIVGGLAGGAIGAIAGYAGGWVDSLLMRCNDILMTIPGILLALAIAGALGKGLFNIVLAVAVSSIPGYARIMRAQIISIKGRTFIAASRSVGATPFHIFWKHVLPNALSPLLVMAAIGVGTAILTGSGLSFLGLGVLREIPDWGTLLSQGRGYLTVAWWICTFPGLAITLFVLAVNIIGDRMRDRLDPKKNAKG
ncbi:ABC transporter permease [Paenibacillus sp. PR3]|uniref:ABC transporter permease n=1 Tax=Paenibacillus terricola TaxID=2763503 RepID=A0ABR8N414_9BACL|nr:ABC transporter permease [Paenibacillus terricola]MBD3921569.1 ABC transporter permease [Paenibacillus terricola]